MMAVGWRFAALSYVAVLLPLVTVPLPRDIPARWDWFAAVMVFAGITAVVNLALLRRMVRSQGTFAPPAWVPLLQAMAATILAGGLNYSLSGPIGIYRATILIPTILITLIGNRMMVTITSTTALATLVVSSYAQGIEGQHLLTLSLSHAATSGTLVLMVRVLASTALSSVRLTDGIAEAATIATQANRLDDGIERFLPIIGTWAVASRVTAHEFTRAGNPGRFLAHWPSGTVPCLPPTDQDMTAARRRGGTIVVGERAVTVAEIGDIGSVSLVIDGIERRRLDSMTYEYHLGKMSQQVAHMMTRSHQIQHLESLGMTDDLTGLPNRRSLEERLSVERGTAQPPQRPLTLAMLDLDNFKAFNDAHGHPAGDELLRQFAAALRTSVRASDFVARYGGEEFCLLLPGTGSDGALTLLDQMKTSIRDLNLGELPSFSAGIATWDGRESPDALTERADRALYRAKAEGKDRTIVAEPPLQPDLV